LPNALEIRAELPTQESPSPSDGRAGKSPVELYREYHMREHQRLPATGVAEAFAELYEHCADKRGV
jgi:hypothetical protein